MRYNPDAPKGRVLFRFTTNPDDNVTGNDDVAIEYVVVECPTAMAGLVVHGRYGRGWVVNPGERHVVKRLLEILDAYRTQRGEMPMAEALE
jgi:hypothetical protein